VGLFLGAYNAVHLALRAWGLHAGWRHGLDVAQALGTPLLRKGPAHVTRATALLAGLALPSAAVGIIGPGRGVLGLVLGGVVAGAALITALQGRLEGWRLAILVLTLFTFLSLVR